MANALEAFTWMTLVYLAMVPLSQCALIVSAAIGLRRHQLTTLTEERNWILGSPVAPTVSILAPAYNEEATVVESVRSLLALAYPRLEVVLVNDGSKDQTMAALQRAFDLEAVHPIRRDVLESATVRAVFRSRHHPELVVVDKENGGKADALNSALNHASGTLVCAIDADTIIEPDGLLKMVRPFLEREDVVAVGGTIRVANGCEITHGRVVRAAVPHNLLALMQVVEYLRAFLFGRLGWNLLGGNMIISGAFGLFRRDSVVDVGGYQLGSVGEDAELVVALRRNANRRDVPGRVEFVPDPIAWTEVPVTLRGLARQRDRWHRGLGEVLIRHAGMIGRVKEGALGIVVSPYFVLVELLAPVVEGFGIVSLVIGLATGAINPEFAALFFLVAYGFGLLINMAALLLEQMSYDVYRGWGERARLLMGGLLEGVLLRPLTVFWRLRGLWSLARKNTEWGAMERQGFGQPEAVGTNAAP